MTLFHRNHCVCAWRTKNPNLPRLNMQYCPCESSNHFTRHSCLSDAKDFRREYISAVYPLARIAVDREANKNLSNDQVSKLPWSGTGQNDSTLAFCATPNYSAPHIQYVHCREDIDIWVLIGRL